MRRAAAAVLLGLSLTGEPAARASAPDPITPAVALAVKSWAEAVRSHTPGRRDDATEHVATLTFGRRLELSPGMTLFLSALLGKRTIASTGSRKDIVGAALRARANPGTHAFLKRAAVLHADAAMQNELDDRTPAEIEVVPPGTPPSPLFSRHNLFLDHDGEIKGEIASDWNWPFARSLLDLIVPRPADDPFVGTWYHATTAFMLSERLYGEVSSHLGHAAAVLDDDALILYDRGCFSEIQGMPVSQVLLSDEDLLALRAHQAGNRPPVEASPVSMQLGVPPADVANEQAERLFRRALRADASLVEARVRLGRLLVERKRHEEALAELDTALAAKPESLVAFYAHLFAGRAAQGLGKIDEAAAHYKEAGALFPGAQSALLAQSQAALLGADVAGALEPIAHIDRSSSALDPWWLYHLAAGRDAEDILRDMWSKAAKF
jgi:tetratricopeptide (TPR) repeat protein